MNRSNFETGLLFYLSGETGEIAEYAKGKKEPTFFSDVKVMDDGADGKKYFLCGKDQKFAYSAPSNIYAERGTLSFFWKAVYPLGTTEFPIFRVGFADHSSWDAVWLRIDYNGKGFDAFVTDVNLTRTRISYEFKNIPTEKEWTHICFSWDENFGVKLYINGNPAGEKKCEAINIYDIGLDQFGPHSRIISHWSVSSGFNYIRQGALDEIKIYDKMITDEQVIDLFHFRNISNSTPIIRSLSNDLYKNQWNRYWGFDNETVPPYYEGNQLSIHKVEIHEAYDHKRWWWKANDGIRETTWPGVYNRSKLTGRTDYFILPDWDCYSVSGKQISFHLPDEACNYIEISGAAYGSVSIGENQIFQRKKNRERTFHKIDDIKNTKITFTNIEQEQPIADFSAYCIDNHFDEHKNYQSFYLTHSDKKVEAVEDFINGRYMKDKTTLFLGVSKAHQKSIQNAIEGQLPFYHMVLPYEFDEKFGIDGVEIRIPPFDSGTDGLYPINIQVKDSIWLYRNLMNVSISLKNNQSKHVYLDFRDRIYDKQNSFLYLTIAALDQNFSCELLSKIEFRVVFKPFSMAKVEHIQDRFVQVRDNYSHLVEEYPRDERLNLYNRFMADLNSLLKVEPKHELGNLYKYDFLKTDKPMIELSPVSENLPAWAVRQCEYAACIKRVIEWWIDKRQIENGEFGGGLSDDGDLTALWPATALMGIMSKKIKNSLFNEMDAFFANEMFDNGLCTIQTDQLHTFEEGIQCLGQCLVLEPHNPQKLETAMDTARAMFRITGVNPKGHTHFLTAYYSGSKMATEFPWGFSNPDSYHVLQPGYMITRVNGNEKYKQLVVDLADSLLAHFRDGILYSVIDFKTDRDEFTEKDREWHLFIAAYNFTKDEKYLKPINQKFIHKAENLGELDYAEITSTYETLIETAMLREYINTEGHLWVDRVVLDINRIQKDRLGGVAHERFACYPQHFISWEFSADQGEHVALVTSFANENRLKINACNLLEEDVLASLVSENLLPGIWEITISWQGMAPKSRRIDFAMRSKADLLLPTRKECIIELKLVQPDVSYWERAELGISSDDVKIDGDAIFVTVHSLGAIESEASCMALKDSDGKLITQAEIPPLAPPKDLIPVTYTAALSIENIAMPLENYLIEIDPQGLLKEITRENNVVRLGSV